MKHLTFNSLYGIPWVRPSRKSPLFPLSIPFMGYTSAITLSGVFGTMLSIPFMGYQQHDDPLIIAAKNKLSIPFMGYFNGKDGKITILMLL